MSKKEIEGSALGALGRMGLVLCLIIFISLSAGRELPDWASAAALVSLFFWVAWGNK